MARSKKTVALVEVETIVSEVVGKMEVTTELAPVEVETEAAPEVETVPVVEVETVPVPEVETDPVPSLPSLVAQLTSLNSPEPEVKKSKSTKNENVWGNVKMLFDQGLGNKEVLAQIHEMYGNTNTSYACIAWYRNKYNKLGQSGKMTVEQLINQVATQFGQDQDWVKAQLSKV